MTPISRRMVLQGSGACLALPALEAMNRSSHAANPIRPTRRLVCVGNPFGFYPDAFFPDEVGRNYKLPVLLQPLAEHVNDFSLFSHLDHGLTGGHQACHAFLSGVKSSDAGGLPEGNISLDQKAAESVGAQTRFPSLHLGRGSNMSWTRHAVPVPSLGDNRRAFEMLFVKDDQAKLTARRRQFDLDRSVLDAVRDQAQLLERRLGTTDQQRLDHYFTSIRELERKLAMERTWLDRPKPKTTTSLPKDKLTEDLALRFEIVRLALQTDSTRVATVWSNPANLTDKFGLAYPSYHKYSHHGRRAELIKGLLVVETYQMRCFARFLADLKSTDDPLQGGCLLDHTITLLGSGLANGSSHSNTDMPILVAGGGFSHGGHHRLPDEQHRRIPLNNLYLSLLHQFGLEIEKFHTSTSALAWS